MTHSLQRLLTLGQNINKSYEGNCHFFFFFNPSSGSVGHEMGESQAVPWLLELISLGWVRNVS